MEWIIAAVIALIFGAIGRNMADKRGRNAWVWFVICALTSLIGVIVLALMGSTRERREADKRRYDAPRAE